MVHMETFTLSGCNQMLWSTEISIGTPDPQTFSVVLDTSSSLLKVPSVNCDESCSLFPWMNYYDYSKSATHSLLSDDGEDKFIGFDVEGEYAVDSVHLGNVKQDPLSTFEQAFVEMTSIQESGDFMQFCENIDGIIGLNLHMTGDPNIRPPIYGLLEDYSYPIFSLYLDGNTDENTYYEETESNSELILGGVNQNHYEGCLHWHQSGLTLPPSLSDKDEGIEEGKVKNTGFWNFGIDDILIGEESSMEAPSLANLNSKSANIVGPSNIVREFALMNSMRCYTEEDMNEVSCATDDFDIMEIECDPIEQNDMFVSLSFIADSVTYEIDLYELSEIFEVSLGNFICRPRLIPSDDDFRWEMGAPFLMKYYSAYDVENMKIGLALASTLDLAECADDLTISLSDKNNLDQDDYFDQDDYLDQDDSLMENVSMQTDSFLHSNLFAGIFIGICLFAVIGLLAIRRRSKVSLEQHQFARVQLGNMTETEDDVGLFRIDDDLELS